MIIISPRSHIIVSDIDGVLANFYADYQAWLWKRFLICMPSHYQTEYDLVECLYDGRTLRPIPALPEDKAVFLECLKEDVLQSESFYMGLKPHSTIWDAYLKWTFAKGEIEFITSRDSKVQSVTAQWLAYHYFRPPVVHFKDKVEGLGEIYGRTNKRILYIEDCTETVQKVHAADLRYVDALLVRRPWNRKVWYSVDEADVVRSITSNL